MTRKQWDKTFRKALHGLSAQEKQAAADYYAELYDDKHDAGMNEEEIMAEFGDPEKAAHRILEEAGISETEKRTATAADTAARAALVVIFGIFIGIPLLSVILSVIVTGIAVAVSGAACVIAGIGQFFFSIVLMVTEGVTGAHIAHLGIGVVATGAGMIIIPLFVYLSLLCIKLLRACFIRISNFITGKRRNNHAKT